MQRVEGGLPGAGAGGNGGMLFTGCTASGKQDGSALETCCIALCPGIAVNIYEEERAHVKCLHHNEKLLGLFRERRSHLWGGTK